MGTLAKWIVPVLFLCFILASGIIVVFIAHWKIGDGRLKVYNDEIYYDAKQVEDSGYVYDPKRRYYKEVTIRDVYTQKGWIGWIVKSDTSWGVMKGKDR